MTLFDYDNYDDQLSEARGIIFAVPIALVMWAIIILAWIDLS